MNILVICTGNQCRSPLAERLLAQALPDAKVSSAGTEAPNGIAMDPQSATELERLGGSAAGHLSRRLTEPMLDEADLVLTATRAHRETVVGLSPRALHRTFTLLELAALGPAVTPGTGTVGTMKERVRAIARLRAGVAREQLDLVDPIGQPDAVHRQVADAIAGAVEQIAATAHDLQAGSA